MAQPERQRSWLNAHLKSMSVQIPTVLWLIEELDQSATRPPICGFEIPARLSFNIYKPPQLGFLCFVAFEEVHVKITGLIIIRLSTHQNHRHRPPCNGKEPILKPQSDFFCLLGRERVRAKREPFRNPFQLPTL